MGSDTDMGESPKKKRKAVAKTEHKKEEDGNGVPVKKEVGDRI